MTAVPSAPVKLVVGLLVVAALVASRFSSTPDVRSPLNKVLSQSKGLKGAPRRGLLPQRGITNGYSYSAIDNDGSLYTYADDGIIFGRAKGFGTIGGSGDGFAEGGDNLAAESNAGSLISGQFFTQVDGFPTGGAGTNARVGLDAGTSGSARSGSSALFVQGDESSGSSSGKGSGKGSSTTTTTGRGRLFGGETSGAVVTETDVDGYLGVYVGDGGYGNFAADGYGDTYGVAGGFGYAGEVDDTNGYFVDDQVAGGSDRADGFARANGGVYIRGNRGGYGRFRGEGDGFGNAGAGGFVGDDASLPTGTVIARGPP